MCEGAGRDGSGSVQDGPLHQQYVFAIVLSPYCIAAVVYDESLYDIVTDIAASDYFEESGAFHSSWFKDDVSAWMTGWTSKKSK